MYFIITILSVVLLIIFEEKKGHLPFSEATEHIPMRYMLIVVFSITAVLSALHIHEGHDWGGDFSEYISQALSIINGNMREQTDITSYMMETSHFQHGPSAYPWGYPLFLVPIIHILRVNYIAIKSANAVIYILMIVVIYYIARDYLDKFQLFLLIVYLAFQPTILEFLDCIYADILFAFFSMLSVHYMNKLFYKDGSNVIYAFMIGINCFLACFTRSNGIVSILTFAAIELFLIVTKVFRRMDVFSTEDKYGICHQNARCHVLVYISFIFPWIVSKRIFPQGSVGYDSYFINMSIKSIIDNALYYIKGFPDFWGIGGIFSLILSVCMVLLCLYTFTHKFIKYMVIMVYCGGMIALLILFPVNYQGIRYAYPVLILLLIPMYDAISDISKKGKIMKYAGIVPYVVALLSLVVAIRYSYVEIKFPEEHYSNYSYNEGDIEMYEYIINNTDSADVIISPKPRVIWLNAHRKGFSLGDNNTERIADAEYALLINSMEGSWYNTYIENLDCCYKEYSNNELTLYKIDLKVR